MVALRGLDEPPAAVRRWGVRSGLRRIFRTDGLKELKE